MIGLRRQGWWSSVCLAAVLAGTAAAEEVAVNGQALPPQPVEQTSAVAEPQAVLNAAGNDAQAAWTTGGVAPISYEWTPVPGTAAQTYAPAAPASNRLFGLIAPSDTCFADFVSPITNPLFFEDPRTLSEVRTIFANHWIPDSNPVFNGGNAQYLAVQARVALTERLSFIATKDGYIWLDSNNEAVIPDNDGWADVAAGLKYNLVRDPQSQLLISTGATFELDVGSHKVFQGRGNGEFHLFTTAGKGFGPRTHWLTASGFRLPSDQGSRSQMWYWSNHLDYMVVNNWYALIEANWFHWMRSGDMLPVGFEGGDLFNLGSTSVAGNDLMTLGIGAKKRFGAMNELGFGYEFPISQRQDLLMSRLYVDLIIRY